MIKQDILYDFLKICSKSLITSLVIGYFVFNIAYLRNPCVMEQNIFWCQDPLVIEERSVIFDQGLIFYEYTKWVINAIFLDFGVFGVNNQTEIYAYSLDALSVSFSMIAITLLIGLLISILLIFLQRFRFFTKNILEPTLSLSLIHLAIYAIYFKFFLTDSSIFSLLLLCFITALGSGVLFDFYTLLNNEHNFIMKKDYVTFARDSGFRPYRFASKELIISIIYISTSRIPIIFGSMIIIEILSQGHYQGIGFSVWSTTFQQVNYGAFFGVTFLSVLVFTFSYYLTEYIKLSVLKK
jgi:hypothetical protein